MILQEIWLAWQDLDEFSLWSILAKSLAYWTTLLAAGSALNLLWLRETAPQTISLLRWFGPTCAVFAILLNSALIPLQASYLMGEWSAIQDPMMLQLAWESPLGDSLLLRGFGLLLLLAIIRPNRLALGISTIGCGLVAALLCLSRTYPLRTSLATSGADHSASTGVDFLDRGIRSLNVASQTKRCCDRSSCSTIWKDFDLECTLAGVGRG